MMHIIGEVVKQYEIQVPGLDAPVKGKIIKEISNNGKTTFTWSISHHYKPTAGAGVYFPSKITTESFEETEVLFKMYAASFVADFQIEANRYY